MAWDLKLSCAEMERADTLPGWKDRTPAQPARRLAVGDVLGGTYRLLQPINHGGMGEVFLAAHERLPMKFAVKVLNPVLFGEEGFAQLGREAAVLAKLRHPNVVQLVDFNWTDSGVPFLVMEHLPGQDLAEILARRPRLSAAQVCAILQPIASALSAAHRVGIVHLDLKPSNVMVVPVDGRGNLVKVIDFGIAMARRVGQPEPAGDILGTPEFMSPEQADGRSEEVGAASDQFSASVIAYLMLSGQLPWRATDADTVLDEIVNCRPRPLPASTGAGNAVTAVLLRGMAKRPADRYPSALAFARALHQAMASEGLLAETELALDTATDHAPGGTLALPITRPTAPVGRRSARHSGRGPRERRVLALALSAALAASLTIFALPWSRGHAPAETWRALRDYANHAAQVCRSEGKALLDHVRRLGSIGS